MLIICFAYDIALKYSLKNKHLDEKMQTKNNTDLKVGPDQVLLGVYCEQEYSFIFFYVKVENMNRLLAFHSVLHSCFHILCL